MQFMVTALDYQDSGALQRRLANREAHLRGIKKLVANGQMISGGALLDDSGERMIGSTMHVDFPDRETLEATLRSDPYVEGQVWETFTIFRCRLV